MQNYDSAQNNLDIFLFYIAYLNKLFLKKSLSDLFEHKNNLFNFKLKLI